MAGCEAMSTTAWYDVFASFYDASLDATYREHRQQALRALAVQPGMTVVDVGCGTGASLPVLVSAVGPTGRVVGVDASSGMLQKAQARVRRNGWDNVVLREVAPDSDHTPDAIARELGVVQRVHCFLSLSVIEAWREVLDGWWQVLAPGGRFVIADVHNPRPGPYAKLVELIASASLPRKSWEPLAQRCADFALDWQESSRSLGGKFFVASGTKPRH
jgi:demethylmenaquinone methyltransferase/2-methoxy-6-polyprenyl-1,4-benzoquinol methylase